MKGFAYYKNSIDSILENSYKDKNKFKKNWWLQFRLPKLVWTCEGGQSNISSYNSNSE